MHTSHSLEPGLAAYITGYPPSPYWRKQDPNLPSLKWKCRIENINQVTAAEWYLLQTKLDESNNSDDDDGDGDDDDNWW